MSLFRKKPDNRLRIFEAMKLRRAYLPDPLPAEGARHLEEARRRCLECNFKALCDEALSSGDRDAFAAFCPNNHYFQQLRGKSWSFGS